MKVYIAGPMTGLPNFNYPAFHAAAERWRAEGWEVLNPAENFGGDQTKDYREYIRADLAMLGQADAIAFLPGWEQSKGATFEYGVAQMLGLEMFEAVLMCRLRSESPLLEAQRLVGGDRQQSYGHPIEDFTRTGKMWGAILGTPEVTPDKVALCMVALKISRECHRPKRDNITDMAGYALTLHMVREKEPPMEFSKSSDGKTWVPCDQGGRDRRRDGERRKQKALSDSVKRGIEQARRGEGVEWVFGSTTPKPKQHPKAHRPKQRRTR